MQPNDAVNSPKHYVGKSGREVIEYTHWWRLGPDLTQAVNYILRAGRKSEDPREDLRKAIYYLRYAGKMERDLVFGMPMELKPTFDDLIADFDVDPWLVPALRTILVALPVPSECLHAADLLERAIEAMNVRALPVANAGNAA